jgi:hypothetical protein
MWSKTPKKQYLKKCNRKRHLLNLYHPTDSLAFLQFKKLNLQKSPPKNQSQSSSNLLQSPAMTVKLELLFKSKNRSSPRPLNQNYPKLNQLLGHKLCQNSLKKSKSPKNLRVRCEKVCLLWHLPELKCKNK